MKDGKGMTPSAAVRALQSQDREAWERLWKGYQEFYRVAIDDATTAATWVRLHDPSEPMHCALAVDATGTPIGLVHWIFHRSNWTVADYCYLQDLYVDPQVRGGGWGRKLIEHVYADAGARGAARVYWLTHESNTQAMRLYDRLAERSGFVQYRHALHPPAAK